jgi:copper chaperone CopZ
MHVHHSMQVLTTNEGELSMTSTMYHVTGMTCEHCVRAVAAELNGLPGVTEVTIDLVPGGTSVVAVVSDTPLDAEAVEAALDEAGDYRLAAPGKAAGPGPVPASRGASRGAGPLPRELPIVE